MNFGGIIVRPDVVLSGCEKNINLLHVAFDENSAIRAINEKTELGGGVVAFVRFEPEIVQFFNDDLSDYSGNFTGLVCDVARRLFEFSKVNAAPCTVDIKEN